MFLLFLNIYFWLEILLYEIFLIISFFFSVKNFKSNKAFISGSFEGGITEPGASSVKTKMINLNDVPITILQALDQSGVSFSEATPNPFLILHRNKKNHLNLLRRLKGSKF